MLPAFSRLVPRPVPQPLCLAASMMIHNRLYPLLSRFGAGVAALSVGPVLVGAWYFGVRGGFWLGLVTWPLNTLSPAAGAPFTVARLGGPAR